MSRQAVVSVFLLLTLTNVAPADQQETRSRRLKVLTYNIHHGEGVDGKLNLKRIAAVITAMQPDIVALQEVDQRVSRSNGEDQPAELARLTELNVVFGDNIKLGAGKYGNALLSRFPIAEFRNHRLPNVNRGEQRGVLQAAIRVPNWPEQLLLFATHLDHRSSDQERFASARAINELALKQPDHPALLAGDLNDVIQSRTLREFEAVWKRANTEPLPTIPVSRPRRQIDFILFRPAERWQTIEVRVLPEALASDHRALFTVLELRAR